ncbi:MAG: Major porin and structural outer rane porin OprF [Myxococcaceae bacterium]|nr:Major porin and structural outer rane porin OprF [Myxococcaceae bacterium]MEA2747559.1 OmpA-OmpF porin, family [Myxococcales bacterium]
MGGTQQSEFGTGGGGSGTVELAVGNVVGVQASGGALVLAAGAAPADPNVAKQSTGSAFMGTVGVRFRPLGASRVAGPWIDANGGFAQTGPATRLAVDAHIGWDFRVSDKTRWDVGPFIGFTQIMQPDVAFRPDDAHIAWAGIQVSLGASEKPRAAPPPASDEQPATPIREADGVAEVEQACPPLDADGEVPEGCPGHVVTLENDRLVLDDVIHFEFNSPVIRRQSYGLVHKVAQFISNTPDILEISIEGHADARGTEEYNQKLSEQRAESTRALLVQFGIDAPRLHAVGHGKSQLKVATMLADPRNRRVEFIVVRSREVAGPPPATSSPKVASGKRGQP